MDRFGEIPKSAENLLRIALIRSHAHRLYMPEVKGKDEVIRFQLRPDARIKVENIPRLLQAYEGRMVFEPKGTPMFRVRYRKCGVIEKDEELLLALTEAVLRDMEELLL